jgi:hypothetical protein
MLNTPARQVLIERRRFFEHEFHIDDTGSIPTVYEWNILDLRYYKTVDVVRRIYVFNRVFGKCQINSFLNENKTHIERI